MYQKRLHYQEPSKHTTLFQRPSNVHNVHITLDERWNDVVCHWICCLVLGLQIRYQFYELENKRMIKGWLAHADFVSQHKDRRQAKTWEGYKSSDVNYLKILHWNLVLLAVALTIWLRKSVCKSALSMWSRHDHHYMSYAWWTERLVFC